jgi:hypothetical protein
MNQQPVLIQSQINAIHDLQSCFYKTHPNITLPSTLMSSKYSYSFSTLEDSVFFSHLTQLHSPTIPLKVWKLIKQVPFSTKGQVCTWGTGIAQNVQWQDYGLDDRGSMVRFPAKSINFSRLQNVETGCRTHPTFYSKGNRFLRWAKAAGAWSWPLPNIYCRG